MLCYYPCLPFSKYHIPHATKCSLDTSRNLQQGFNLHINTVRHKQVQPGKAKRYVRQI